jgi:hypothetical protein
MSIHIQPMSELTQRARNALTQELGVIDAMRFLNQFRAGNGDYTTERETLFKSETVKSIVADIKALRSGETEDAFQSTT